MVTKKEEIKEITVPEALGVIQEQRVELEKLREEARTKDQRILDLTKRGAGWLITTPNKAYDGITAGIQFHNGCSFVPVTQKFEKYVIQVMKPSQLKNLSKEDRESYDRETLRSSAERAVQYICQDFGYESQYFDGTDPVALERIINDRAALAAEIRAKELKNRNELENLTTPNYVRA